MTTGCGSGATGVTCAGATGAGVTGAAGEGVTGAGEGATGGLDSSSLNIPNSSSLFDLSSAIAFIEFEFPDVFTKRSLPLPTED